MKRKSVIIILSLLSLATGRASAAEPPSDPLTVASPDGTQQLTLALDGGGRARYTAVSCGDTLVPSSPLGLKTMEAAWTFDGALSVKGVARREISEEYDLPTGKRSHYVNHAREMRVSLANAAGNTLDVVARACDDGLALRYELHNGVPVTVERELTACRLPKGATVWMMDWKSDYENYYLERRADTIGGGREYLYPALVRSGSRYMLLTEAAVYDLPAMHLRGTGGALAAVYAREDTAFATRPAFTSSWKVFVAGHSLGDIVESTIVENLNPPSAATDLGWITPGVAVFPWWGDYMANGDKATLKRYVDLAAEMHWQWIEFDVSLIGSPWHSSREWRRVTWIPEITAYAHSRGIKVYGWDEIAVLADPDERAYVLDGYRRMGIDGIKIDYIDSDSRRAMRFRDEVTAYALDHHMLVSFHGETVPRGQRRRYPNIMTNEGVKGAEYYTFPGAPCANSWHNCMLPFTRNAVGPMDYTPATYTVRPENPRTTTYAHETALPFAFESGWTCMADRPEAYLASPAKPLLQKLVTAWDETRFVDGRPGEYFCVARRKGARWFVAAINGRQARRLTVPLAFLGKGRYTATLYEDSPAGSDSLKVTSRKGLTAKKRVTADLLPSGGFVMELDATP